MTEARRRLVASLVEGLHPVRRVRLGRVFLALLAVELGALLAGVAVAGMRADLGDRLAEARFVALAGGLAIAAFGGAWAALRSSIPGREPPVAALAFLFLLPVAAGVAAASFLPWGGRWEGAAAFVGSCSPCIANTALVAVGPWVVAVFLVARMAPLRPMRTALVAGVSAFAVGALATELHCGARDGYHLAIGHYLPVAVLAAVAALGVAGALRLSTRAGKRS